MFGQPEEISIFNFWTFLNKDRHNLSGLSDLLFYTITQTIITMTIKQFECLKNLPRLIVEVI